jgi:hypothetical protein
VGSEDWNEAISLSRIWSNASASISMVMLGYSALKSATRPLTMSVSGTASIRILTVAEASAPRACFKKTPKELGRFDRFCFRDVHPAS